MSKDDFYFFCDLLDKADEKFKRKIVFDADNGMYIDYLDRKADALKAKHLRKPTWGRELISI
jgi:hypothetical protein